MGMRMGMDAASGGCHPPLDHSGKTSPSWVVCITDLGNESGPVLLLRQPGKVGNGHARIAGDSHA